MQATKGRATNTKKKKKYWHNIRFLNTLILSNTQVAVAQTGNVRVAVHGVAESEGTMSGLWLVNIQETCITTAYHLQD